MGFLKQNLNKKLLFIFCSALIIRLFFSYLPAFEYDQNDFRFWSMRLAEVGPGHFYSKEVFTNNPVGFLYILWVIGLIKINFIALFQTQQVYDLLLKLPNNLADLATAILIYLIIKRKLGEKIGLVAFCLYVFNPAIIFDSAIWGQYDGIAAFFLLLSTYLLIIKNSPAISSIFVIFSWALKPQTLSFAPIFLFLMLLTTKPKQWIFSLISITVIASLIYLPFFPSNPLLGLIYTNIASSKLFNCTTCFALNFWGVFGNWQNDLKLVSGISLLYFGIIFLVISYIPIFFLKPVKKHFQEPIVYLTIAISIMSFFMLLTRMHERYLFPFFAFFLIGSILLKSKKLLFLYFFYSAVFLINLYIPYSYYNQKLIFDRTFIQVLINNFSILSLVSFTGFIIIMIYYLIIIRNFKS